MEGLKSTLKDNKKLFDLQKYKSSFGFSKYNVYEEQSWNA